MTAVVRWTGIALIVFGTFVTVRFLYLFIVPLGQATFIMGPMPFLVGIGLVIWSRQLGDHSSFVSDFAKLLVLVGVFFCWNVIHSRSILSMGDTAALIGAPLALIGLALHAWSRRNA